MRRCVSNKVARLWTLRAALPFIFFLLSRDVFHSGLISSNPGCGGGKWSGGEWRARREREEKEDKKEMKKGGVEINLLTLFTLPAHACKCARTHMCRMTVQNMRVDNVSKSSKHLADNGFSQNHTHTQTNTWLSALLHTGGTEFSGYLLVLVPRRPLPERRDVPD